jgi:signal transduction histidine kinase
MRFRSCVFRRLRRDRPARTALALGAILIAGHGIYTYWSLDRSYNETLLAAGSQLERLAAAAAENIARSLSEINVMLGDIAQITATLLPASAIGGSSLNTMLGQFCERSSLVGDILVLDDNGHELNRARATQGETTDYSTRLLFTAPRGGASSLYIEAPRASRVGSGWSMAVSRPFRYNGDGIGVVAAVVPTASFTRAFDVFAGTDGTQLDLLLADGTPVGKKTARTIGFRPASAPKTWRAAVRNGAGRIEASEGQRGVLRAVRSVAGGQLIVVASRERGQVLNRWYGERDTDLAGFALFAAAVVSSAWLALRVLRRGQFAAAYRCRSETRLKRQSALLQNTLDNIGEGLSVFDARGRLAARNSRFCELLTLPPDMPVGTPLSDILMRQAVRGDFGDVDPTAETALRLEQFYREVPTVKERVTPAGHTLQIRRSAMPDGAVLSIYSDVTEIRAAERKLLQARSQAEAANHSKSEFLANMSHELRTPLNAIIGFTEIISQELFGPIGNEKYLEYIKDVHSSSLHLLSIINDVLDMSKIEAGKLELAKQAVTLQEVIGDVTRIVRERASSRCIELVSRSAAEPVVIWADERAMKQIFLNLLSNAIKFSKEGERIDIRIDAEAAGSAAIEVEDHGIGMDQEEQERALLPFGQAKPATTRNYGGTGLGLPITKGLVEAQGGTLSIRSRPGEGTIVRVVLPTHPALTLAGADPSSHAETFQPG